MSNIELNVLNDIHDERDYVYMNCIDGITRDGELPDKYQSNITRIENQGRSSTCVWHALTTGMEIKQMMVDGHSNVPELSVLFGHAETKLVDGYPNEKGTTYKAALEVLRKTGVCRNELMPFIYTNDCDKNIFPKRTSEMYNDAKRYRIAKWARVGRDVNEIKRAIYNEGVCFISNRCFENYLETYKGIIRRPYGKYIGNHATAFIGWDDSISTTIDGVTHYGCFIRANSYGTNQGIDGIEYVPYVAITEWKVIYDVDTWFKDAFVAISNEKLKNPDYHKLNPPKAPIEPKKTVKLYINRTEAYIDGKRTSVSLAPKIENNTTLVPVRFVAEAFGCFVSYTPAKDNVFNVGKSEVCIKNDDKVISMFIGETKAYINGKPYYLIQPPKVQNGTTLVPIRAVSEMLGYVVDYDTANKKITIVG